MAPRAKTIEDALVRAVRQIYNSPERPELTVNMVRKRVEDNLDLEDGYLKNEGWKAKSKEIITAAVSEAEKAEADVGNREAHSSPAPAPEKKAAGMPRNGAKRSSPGGEAPAKKRRKSKAIPSDEIDEPVDSDKEPPPKKRKQPAKRGRKKKAEPSDEDDEEEEDEEPEITDESDFEKPPKKKQPAKRGRKKAAKGPKDDTVSDDSADAEDDPKADSEGEAAPKPKERPKVEIPSVSKSTEEDSPLSELKSTEEDPIDPVDEESEMSEVIDEPPKRKRKSKEPAAKKNPAKTKKVSSKPAPVLSPDDAEIKKLQGQLVKCGVRKIWGIELKKYGDDTKGKIRHLKRMLSDIGMDGRFSDAKAKEIKERRELEADLEAVTEMNSHWGAEGGRPSRSRAPKKSLKEQSDSDDGRAGNDEKDDVGADDSDADAQPFARARGSAKHRADLAFLGDESESD